MCWTGSTGGSRGFCEPKAFGAELDLLSDAIAFGVSPAVLLYLWSLQEMPRFGWIAVLGLALSCALRLARFNAK